MDMQPPALPGNENERLQALYQCSLLNTPAEERFDRLTRLAQTLFLTQMALVSLVDAERQWFKSRQGLDATETPRSISFCGHAILGNDILEVDNALLDPRFTDNPLVTGSPHIRFYAGAPLKSPDGFTIGTLCIIDDQPRQLTDRDRLLLKELAGCVEEEIRREKLIQEGNTLRSIIDGTRIGTWEWNVQTGATVFNERWADIVGHTLAELAPININTWLALAHPDDLATSHDLLERHFRGQLDHYECVSRMRHKDGRWVWVQDRGRVTHWTHDGKPLLMHGSHTDVTEQVNTRLALEEQEAHLRHLLGNLPGTVYRCANHADWTMHFMSDYVQMVTGYPASDFLPAQGGKRTFASIIHPDDEQRVREAVENFLNNQRGFSVEYRIRHADGHYRWVQELGRGVFDASGKLLYLDGFIWDVTDKKQLEQMKNEFISTVSHELRTPLTSITAALGLVSSGALSALPDRVDDLISIAHRNSQRLSLLINDLLDMEKLGAGKMQFEMQTQPLLPLVQEALDANRTYGSGRNVSLRLTDSADNLTVTVDSRRLMQVMSNLLSNAIKYSPPSGQVDVRVYRSGTHARVDISDRGPGVPAAFHNRIFEKFAQADASTSREKGGTGLGLAITRELVERMGGRVGFHSEEGRGCTFHFELPLAN